MKFLLVKLWSIFQWFFIFLKNFHLNLSESLRVFYGGGFSGNYGGAFVKIKGYKNIFLQVILVLILSINYQMLFF